MQGPFMALAVDMNIELDLRSLLTGYSLFNSFNCLRYVP